MRRVGRIATFIVTFICSLMVGAVGQAGASTCPLGFRYNYVSLDDAKPADALFVDYFKVTDDRHLYGNALTCGDVSCVSSIVVHHGPRTTVLHSNANGYTANESGTVGGSVVTGPDGSIEQAALFNGKNVRLIPRLPGERSSHVVQLTDSGIALVESDPVQGTPTFYLFNRGSVAPLELGPTQAALLHVNDSGLVSGTYFSVTPDHHDRAFRFRPPAGPAQLLEPTPRLPDSWGMAINNEGDVLGYSFVGGGVERIGRWNDGKFRTWFVEGTPEIPTVSNSLLWNEAGLIVVTRTNDGNSYIVPQPGVRLNLADLTTGLPVSTWMVDVNNNGDVLGGGGSSPGNIEHEFLLEQSCIQG